MESANSGHLSMMSYIQGVPEKNGGMFVDLEGTRPIGLIDAIELEFYSP